MSKRSNEEITQENTPQTEKKIKHLYTPPNQEDYEFNKKLIEDAFEQIRPISKQARKEPNNIEPALKAARLAKNTVKSLRIMGDRDFLYLESKELLGTLLEYAQMCMPLELQELTDSIRLFKLLDVKGITVQNIKNSYFN